MSKKLLLDLDGVVIRARHKYFSERYSEEHNVPLEDILPFFKGEYKKAAVGEVDIKEVLPAYFKKWGWKGSVDEFLQYWFESEREVDERVLKIIRDLRQRGVKVYLASDNEANRARYLMEEVGLKDEFDECYFSSDLGVTKSKPQFFEKVVKELGIKPENMEYWDDDPKCVKVARGFGTNGNVYEDFDRFKDSVSNLADKK